MNQAITLLTDLVDSIKRRTQNMTLNNAPEIKCKKKLISKPFPYYLNKNPKA